MFYYQVTEWTAVMHSHRTSNSITQKHLSNVSFVPDNARSLGDRLSHEVYKPEQ